MLCSPTQLQIKTDYDCSTAHPKQLHIKMQITVYSTDIRFINQYKTVYERPSETKFIAQAKIKPIRKYG